MEHQNFATVLVQGCVAGQEFGIDGYAWELGRQFGGLCDVEPGLHLLVFGTKNGLGRQGIFVSLEPGEVILKKWDSVLEQVAHAEPLPSGAEEQLRRVPNKRSVGLGDYPKGHIELWRRLSERISPETLRRCGLDLDLVFSPLGTPPDDDMMLLETENKNDEFDEEMSLQVTPKWTSFDRPRPATTADHLDGSDLVRALVRTVYNGNFTELVAEIDLAFIVFLALGSLAALKHWQKGLDLVCSCDSLLADETFGSLVASSLRAHFDVAPSDFFRDPIVQTADDVLRPALAHFFESRPSASDLFNFVQGKFQLFDDALTITDARDRGLFDAMEDRPQIVVVDDEEPSTIPLFPEDDPQTEFRVRGFPGLADAVDPMKEDAVMTAARVLDEGRNPTLMNEARRYLISRQEQEEDEV